MIERKIMEMYKDYFRNKIIIFCKDYFDFNFPYIKQKLENAKKGF